MKTNVIKKTYRDNPVEVTVFAQLSDLVAKVGEQAVLDLYQEYYLARRVGSMFDKELKEGESYPTEVDLTAIMPTYGSQERGGGYGIELQWLELAMKDLIAGGIFPRGTKVKDAMSGDKSAAVLKYAEGCKADAAKRAKARLAEFGL